MKSYTHGIIEGMKEAEDRLETKSKHRTYTLKHSKNRRTSYQITDKLASVLLIILIILCGVIW